MSWRRRAVFALLTTAAVLGLLEGVGRALFPDPRTEPQVLGDRGIDLPYDPGTRVVAEGPGGGRSFLRGGDTFHPAFWRMPKPAGVLRLVTVGDSTVFGPFPGELARGFSVPGRKVELLNAGVRAIASDRVRIVVGEMLRQAPDLLLVYVGHNQLLDARLNAAALEPFWRRRVRSAIQNGGIGRALRWALPRPVPALQILAGPDAREFGPVTAAERATVEAAYGADLAAMCDAANAAGVPIVLVEPVSSLLRIPELAEATDPHTERQVRIRARMQALAADPATDLTADAAEEARTAPGSAFAHYLAGVVALTHGDRDAAIAALREARRLDEHPWRVTESMAAVIQDVGDRCGARVLVPETAFLADPRYLQIGDPLFEDQVHPSVPGVYLLAQAVADGIAPLLPPGTTWAIADPLAVTPPPPVPSALRPAPAEPAAVGQPQR